MTDRDLADKIYQYLPNFLNENEDSVMYRYIESHGEELDDFEKDVNSVTLSRQVENASGEDLDRLGRLFGTIGRRRGREDQDYRNYIKSIVPVFSGRGTRDDVRRAVSAALSMPMENFSIEENTTTVSYAIFIHDWTDHDLTGLREIAEIADPSGVHLTDVVYGPIENEVETSVEVTYTAGETFEEPPVLSSVDVYEGDQHSFDERCMATDEADVLEFDAAWDVSNWGTMRYV